MKYKAMGREFNRAEDCVNYLAYNYFPELDGEQLEDDRWYALHQLDMMKARGGEQKEWVNGFLVEMMDDTDDSKFDF